MKKAVVYDIDGTLSNVTAIRHYVIGRVKNFDKFHRESVNAPCHQHVVDAARRDKEAGYDVIIVTARKF